MPLVLMYYNGLNYPTEHASFSITDHLKPYLKYNISNPNLFILERASALAGHVLSSHTHTNVPVPVPALHSCLYAFRAALDQRETPVTLAYLDRK